MTLSNDVIIMRSKIDPWREKSPMLPITPAQKRYHPEITLTSSTNFMKRTFLTTLLIIFFLTGCAAPVVASTAAVPTTLFLVTAPANATPTLTPFQPLSESETPTPFAPSTDTTLPNAPTATFDSNAILPAESTPQSFYAPPYAPEPVPALIDNQTATFLLLGSDKRPGQTYFRTDTIIIAAVRPATGQVTLISVPRDLYVYIPTIGMDRVNAAYEYGQMHQYPGGGTALLKDTILYNLGIRIDHLAIVDFDGFRRIVDTLGGLDVPVFCSYTDWHLIDPSYDPENENNWALYTVGPGLIHMDGDLALWYARSRKKSSDFDRGRRSQEVLRALYMRALQTNAISKLPQLFNDFSSSVITDLGLNGILQLAPLALHLNNADIRSYYIGRDDVTSWMTPGGASVLLPNALTIQSKLQQALSPSPRIAEQAALTVEVRNGTVNPAWDALAAERLNYAGYNTRLAPSDRLDYPNTLLYDLAAVPDLNRATSLLTILGLPSTAFVTAPTQTNINYVVILGADYQPCFKPDGLTP
jgi:polyisoprenyl-teichoic acid--peptidoglycan teichoic acid transferase